MRRSRYAIAASALRCLCDGVSRVSASHERSLPAPNPSSLEASFAAARLFFHRLTNHCSRPFADDSFRLARDPLLQDRFLYRLSVIKKAPVLLPLIPAERKIGELFRRVAFLPNGMENTSIILRKITADRSPDAVSGSERNILRNRKRSIDFIHFVRVVSQKSRNVGVAPKKTECVRPVALRLKPGRQHCVVKLFHRAGVDPQLSRLLKHGRDLIRILILCESDTDLRPHLFVRVLHITKDLPFS